MLPPTDLDGLSHADLKSLVLKLLEEAAELRRTVAAQRDEIARLKGGPGRPNIKPSGMDKATEPRPPPPTGSEPRQKGGKTSKLSIHEERTVTVAAPPQGSRFKGYTNFVVQDLVIRSHVVNFRRERWQKPDGDMMTAPLPAGISGHFGPELRRFVLAQYHQGQMTVPRLLAQLRAFGIVISKRQLAEAVEMSGPGDLAGEEALRMFGQAGDHRGGQRALTHVIQRLGIDSGGTRSDTGRDCRDAFLGLSKTCAKLGFAFWDYLGSRLAVPNQPEVPYLPAIVRHRCATA